MDRLERFESPQDALMKALAGWQSNMWTALPAIVQSFNATAMTCEVQPTIEINFKSPVDGSIIWKSIPLLRDCPVVFPSGGGAMLTFPIVAGDEVLVVFSSRCIDAWWAYGKVQKQPALRMHNLSDGFVIPGIKSQPNVIANISTTETELRSDDGNTVIGLNAASGTITLKASTININGTVNVTGALNNNGKSVGSALRVGGVQPGSGTSGTPV
jgi:Phage protein Gp138 N-terminal domain